MAEGSHNFFDTPGANPKYVEAQRRVIENLKVGTIKEILPQELDDFYSQHKNKERSKVNTLDGTLKFQRMRDVCMVRKLQPRHADSQIPYDSERVVGYYLIDETNGTAWDVSQLWTEPVSGSTSNKKQPEIITSSDPLFKLGRRAGATSDHIMLDSPAESTFVQRLYNKLNSLNEETSYIADTLITPHEAGHSYQFDPNKRFPLSHKYIFLSHLLNLFPFLGKVVDRIPVINKGMQNHKNIVSDTERNANAFAVAVIRKLREQKLDLLRGVSNSDLFGVIETHFLTGYERGLQHISGKWISQANRHPNNTSTLQQVANGAPVKQMNIK